MLCIFRQSDRRAFSLIEMLVVISIITMLISLLLPSLGKARYHARLVKCQINIDSQWQAQTMLADDNAGRFWRHNDFSADYIRSNNAPDSVWEAIDGGGYLTDGMATICPIQQVQGGVWDNAAHDRYTDPFWNESTYAGWHADTPQVLTTYMWFGNYKTGNGYVESGATTLFLDVDGQPEPMWARSIDQANSSSAFITHRISGGPGYASHDLGHLGRGLAITADQLLVDTPDQPVGFSDRHVIARPASEIEQRTLINTGGIGYYWY